MSAVEPAFDRLTHVSQQVPAVCDLQGLGSAEAGAAGVLGRAVPGHDLDAGPLHAPTGQRRRCAVGEKVDDAVAVQVHHDRAVAAALSHALRVPPHRASLDVGPGPLRPVVDADVDGCRLVRHRHGPDEPQNGGAARRHAQVLQEPRPTRAAADNADPPLRFGQPARAPSAGPEEIGHRLGEGAPGAARVGAVEASNLDAQRRLQGGDRQIGRVAVIAAVDGSARLAALGTSTGLQVR